MTLAVSLFGAAACVEPDVGEELPEPTGVAELVIDAGREVEMDPGQGVGVAVEYGGDGAWSVATSCDTAVSGVACLFDIIVSVEGTTSGITDITGVGLEPRDYVDLLDRYAAQLELSTGDDLDRVEFDTDPGATVRVSALLYAPVRRSSVDWTEDPRIISWVGDGALHWGAPTNPVDLAPDRP